MIPLLQDHSYGQQITSPASFISMCSSNDESKPKGSSTGASSSSSNHGTSTKEEDVKQSSSSSPEDAEMEQVRRDTMLRSPHAAPLSLTLTQPFIDCPCNEYRRKMKLLLHLHQPHQQQQEVISCNVYL